MLSRPPMLATIYDAINKKEISILSLDIFDTLAWRKMPLPEDLFLLLGKKLQKQGWLIPAVNFENFAKLRIEAEKKARYEKSYTLQSTEVTLCEIYWNLKPAFVSLTTEQMLAGKTGIYETEIYELVKMELALEKALIQLDVEVAQLARYAFEHQVKVIAVSDTYIEEEDLRSLLNDPPYVHRYFLSCAYGCSKSCGLFGHVLEHMQCPPDKMIHLGDNYKSDIIAASRVQIRAVHYPKQSLALKEIIKREQFKEPAAKLTILDPLEGDFGLTALRGKISQRSCGSFFWNYGATILGPVLLGFTHWLYTRCQEMQIGTLYCLMREGKLYGNLIRRYAPYYPKHTLQAKELYTSRLFMTHVAIHKASFQELLVLMNSFVEKFTVEDFCSHLGLDVRKMPKWRHNQHVMLEDATLREKLLLHLSSEPQLRQIILDVALQKRNRFLNYLSCHIDLSKADQMTLADVGWNGSQQMALQQILKLENSSIRLHGLYLGTSEKSNNVLLQGSIIEGYLFQGGSPSCSNAHKKSYFVLEQTATAETGIGPFKDILDDGTILNYPFLIPEKQQKECEEVQRGIFDFFDHAGKYIQSGALVLNGHSSALKNQLRAILLRSMINTTQKEAFQFSSWLHEHRPDQMIQPFAQDTYCDQFIKDMLPAVGFKEDSLNWLAAYAAKQSKYLTLATEALSLNTLPPECFLSQDSYPLHIFLDTGRNFPEKANFALKLQSNQNRSFFTLSKIFCAKKQIKRLQLCFSFPSSLVRIKTLRINAYSRKQAGEELYTFYETDKSEQMVCLNGEQIDSSTFRSQNDLKFLYTFQNLGIYQIKLTLCCEMFPLKS